MKLLEGEEEELVKGDQILGGTVQFRGEQFRRRKSASVRCINTVMRGN